MRIPSPVALAVLCGVSGACYSYAPIETPAPEPGAFIVVTLSDSASYALAHYLGPDVTVVRGRVIAQDSEAIHLAVASVASSRRIETSWKGEPIELPRAGVTSIELRRFSAGRSVLLAGAGLSGIVATGAAFGLIGGGGSGGSAGTPPKH